MNDNRFQIEVYKECQRRRCKPRDLTDADFLRIALRLRSKIEIVRDGVKVGISTVAVYLGRRVPLPVYQERRAACLSKKCGRAEISRDGNPVCMVCGCSGANMEAALWDANEACRLPPAKRLWDAHATDNAGNTESVDLRLSGDADLRRPGGPDHPPVLQLDK